MGAVDDVGVDDAPRAIILESIPDCFPVSSVPVSDDVITSTVELLSCQLGLQFWFLLLALLILGLGWSLPCNFSKDVA